MIVLKRLAVANYKGIRALDLTFPERGSILIEGRNEAGKSTLFDAVHYALYGVPMVGDGRARACLGLVPFLDLPVHVRTVGAKGESQIRPA